MYACLSFTFVHKHLQLPWIYQIAATNVLLLDLLPVPYKQILVKRAPLKKHRSGSQSSTFSKILSTSNKGKGKV
jgi:hypothetical protein